MVVLLRQKFDNNNGRKLQQISGEYIGLPVGPLNLNPRRLRTVVGFSPLVDEDNAEPVWHLRHVEI